MVVATGRPVRMGVHWPVIGQFSLRPEPDPQTTTREWFDTAGPPRTDTGISLPGRGCRMFAARA
jgi:hypothetical protein